MAVAAAAAALALVGGSGARSAAPAPEEAIVDGAALAASAVAVGAANPDFDFWPVFSLSTVDNEASHGISAGTWPGFLIDAFFWLYGFQSTERAALGIAESQFPNPPHAASASSSAFLLSNFSQGCRFLFGAQGPATDGCRQASDPIFRDPPGAVATSSSDSAALASEGRARATRFAYPGILEASDVVTSSDVAYTRDGTLTEATLVARDVIIGGALEIESVRARSVALASGDEATSRTASELELGRATFAGQDVVIDDGGVHLVADRSADAVNEALAAQGLEVRLARGRTAVTGDGEYADAATGGLVVRVARERAEEAFPVPVRESRDAACGAASASPVNQEITRVRVDEANPGFGRVPFAPLPERLELEQSVPPPFGCPFLNRSFEISLVLGVTNASARLSPLPAFAPGEATPIGTVLGPATTIRTYEIPGREGRPAASEPSGQVTVAAQPPSESVRMAATFDEGDVANGLKGLYAGLLVLAVLAGVGRSFMRSVSAP